MYWFQGLPRQPVEQAIQWSPGSARQPVSKNKNSWGRQQTSAPVFHLSIHGQAYLTHTQTDTNTHAHAQHSTCSHAPQLIKKWVKNLSIHVIKKDVQILRKHMERCWIAPVSLRNLQMNESTPPKSSGKIKTNIVIGSNCESRYAVSGISSDSTEVYTPSGGWWFIPNQSMSRR